MVGTVERSGKVLAGIIGHSGADRSEAYACHVDVGSEGHGLARQTVMSNTSVFIVAVDKARERNEAIGIVDEIVRLAVGGQALLNLLAVDIEDEIRSFLDVPEVIAAEQTGVIACGHAVVDIDGIEAVCGERAVHFDCCFRVVDRGSAESAVVESDLGSQVGVFAVDQHTLAVAAERAVFE